MTGGGDQIFSDGVRVDSTLKVWTDIGHPKKRGVCSFNKELPCARLVYRLMVKVPAGSNIQYVWEICNGSLWCQDLQCPQDFWPGIQRASKKSILDDREHAKRSSKDLNKH